ncbi:MAG: DUF3817 domain-containing protein [Verrucomicrobiales bacterium]
MKQNPIPFFRTTGIVEAASYLLLVLVAMPLKYIWDMPLAVRWIGMAHGVLFVLYCLALLRVMVVAKWPFSRGVLYFLVSLVPFGPLVADKKLKVYQDEFDRAHRRGQ